MEITVKFDTRKLKAFSSNLRLDAMREAVANSLNDVSKVIKTDMRKQIQTRSAIKTGAANKGLELTSPKNVKQMSLEQMRVTLGAKAAQEPIDSYKYRELAPRRNSKKHPVAGSGGVKVEIVKGRSKLLKGAFVSSVKYGKNLDKSRKIVAMRATEALAKGLPSRPARKAVPRRRDGLPVRNKGFVWGELSIWRLFTKSVGSSVKDNYSPMAIQAQNRFNKRMSFHFVRALDKAISKALR